MIMSLIKEWLAHPLTRDLAIDDPATTLHRREIIKEKGFLKSLYIDWYCQIAASLPEEIIHRGTILEIGSGASFLKEFIPKLITSEVFPIKGIDRVIDARRLPFDSDSLDAIVMTDVFHHIQDVTFFLEEAVRCLRPSGRLLMIEPWKNSWSSWVYKNLHHELFDTEQDWWKLSPLAGSSEVAKPLSFANSAIPWMVFERDQKLFRKHFPDLKIDKITPQMPFVYLLSGGVSLRGSFPQFSYRVFRFLESICLEERFGMFARIEISKA